MRFLTCLALAVMVSGCSAAPSRISPDVKLIAVNDSVQVWSGISGFNSVTPVYRIKINGRVTPWQEAE